MYLLILSKLNIQSSMNINQLTPINFLNCRITDQSTNSRHPWSSNFAKLQVIFTSHQTSRMFSSLKSLAFLFSTDASPLQILPYLFLNSISLKAKRICPEHHTNFRSTLSLKQSATLIKIDKFPGIFQTTASTSHCTLLLSSYP